MSSQGYLKLLELRRSYFKYAEVCQGYADSPFEKERWMLHYDVLTYLVDDEKFNENIDDDSGNNIRFIMLEGLSKETALMYQNFYLGLKGEPPLTRATADAIDKRTKDLIELKVTWIPESGTTAYLEKSVKEAEDTGMVLVIADTNSCQVYQPMKKVFTKGLDLVRTELLKRRAVMEEYNMSDNSILKRIELTPLPSFLLNKFKNLNLRNHEFFDVAKAKYAGKSKAMWRQIKDKKTERKEKTKVSLKRTYDRIAKEIGSSKKARIDAALDNAAMHIDIETDDEKVKTVSLAAAAKIDERKKDENKTKALAREIERASIALENVETPCANKKAELVQRPLDFKEGNFLEEMNKGLLLSKLREVDSTEIGSQTLKWRGLILPLTQVNPVVDLELNDIAMNSTFEDPIFYSKDGLNDWKGFKALLREIERRPMDILELSTRNLSKVISEGGDGKDILDLFGIGWKQFKQIGLNEPEGIEYEFEDKPKAGPTGQPKWFEDVREGMRDEFMEGFLVMPTLTRRESLSLHPIDNFSDKIVNEISNKICYSNALFYCSFTENIYNRLGGMLAASEGIHVRERGEGKRQYNNLRIQANMLESVCYQLDDTDDKMKRRKIGIGVVFRGPTHARNPTDSTNLFIMTLIKREFIKEEVYSRRMKEMHPNYSWGFCKVNNKEMAYGIRRYAVRRIDPTFYSFVGNTLFEPMNSLGDEAIKDMAREGFSSIQLERYYTGHILRNFESRFAENIIIGINMTNFDEGLMPFVRYEFLNSQARKNGERSFNLHYESYLKKLIAEYERAGVCKYLLHDAIF